MQKFVFFVFGKGSDSENI